MIGGIGVFIDDAMANLDELPAVTMGLCGLFLLATALPWLGLNVRRLHDLGLTGWLVLLFLVPTFGSLIMLVFALFPTQSRENQWGPVPAGVDSAAPCPISGPGGFAHTCYACILQSCTTLDSMNAAEILGGKAMRGTLFHYDEDQDYGYINGADGKRYIFARADLRQKVPMVRGTLVEFRAGDGTAHDIVAAASPAGDKSPPRRPQQPDRRAEHQSAASMGLWAYFRRALMQDYRNFHGRARRKEFWAFWLCSTIVLFALFGFGILVNLAINGFGSDAGKTSIGYIPAILFAVLMTLPWIALVVRRVHDTGLTGWLALLCFIPPVGGLALLVFGLIPSQVSENPWGPVPAGVRV